MQYQGGKSRVSKRMLDVNKNNNFMITEKVFKWKG